jgi:hypothetical protein
MRSLSPMVGDPAGVGDHIEWLLRMKFKAPEEWLGDEGDKFRTQCRIRPMPDEIKEAWAKHGV